VRVSFSIGKTAPFAFALLLGAGSAHAQIYGGADSNGVVVLSNFSSEETPQLVVSAPVVEAPFVQHEAAVLKDPAPIVDLRDPAAAYRSMIEKVAKEVSMSPKLLNAVIRVESGYQANIVSRKGAIGLMQLMPATAQRFGVRDAFDPQQNIRGGALYLKWLLDYFRGDLRLTLAAYNAGEGAVVKAGYRIPPIAETIDYVPKVLWFISRASG
jgi:soluble lytic murein transglycosylase-like protein